MVKLLIQQLLLPLKVCISDCNYSSFIVVIILFYQILNAHLLKALDTFKYLVFPLWNHPFLHLVNLLG